jgi:transposase-like protein
LDKVPVSDLCEELGLRPTVFYRWQKKFFENGAASFQSTERPRRQVDRPDALPTERSVNHREVQILAS